MSNNQASRPMYGGSNNSITSGSVISQLRSYVNKTIEDIISKGLDSPVGTTTPNTGIFTSLQALGSNATSMIWNNATGVLRIIGSFITDNITLGYERINTNGQALKVTVGISIIIANDTNFSVTLPNGSQDGQIKQVILQTGNDVRVQGSFLTGSVTNDTSIVTSLYLRYRGNCFTVVWDNQLQTWSIINNACYVDPSHN